jgi:NAD(P)-dependent dehydrogenase (short-subunit alcohol dehydrogenase family)
LRRDFDNKVVVITGGAGGIGMAFARRFGRAGARIVLFDLLAEGLEKAAAQLNREGIQVRVQVCDVTDAEACRHALEEVVLHLGGIDVLMANAGTVHRSAFSETSLAVFRRVMEVNFFGALNCARAALPALAQARGLLVVTSSIAGLAPLFGRSGYAASKHALHGLFESSRAEFRTLGVDLLMVCPSFTRSGFEQAAMGADGRPVGRPRTQVGGLAEPDAVAEAVFQGASKSRKRLILSPVGKVSAVLSRLLPSLYEHLMVRRLAGELQGASTFSPAEVRSPPGETRGGEGKAHGQQKARQSRHDPDAQPIWRHAEHSGSAEPAFRADGRGASGQPETPR